MASNDVESCGNEAAGITQTDGRAGPPDPDLRLGTTIDKYTVIRLIGRGGMGAVYEVRHATLARRFALKVLLPALATNREVLRRFENEAKAAGGLEHPNLVAVTDFGRASDGAPYLVMEFLEGDDCGRLLRRLGPLPVPRAVNIVVQACRGLAVAHRAAIVHRDLKPENLFITDAGDGSDLVKVLDFGIAKLRPTEASVITGTGAAFGTAYYMSPEQARGAGEVDGRADVWSLGVLLYELLSGHRPFEGDKFLNVIHLILSADPSPLSKFRPGLPTRLVAVIERAMSKDLGGRYPSVVALGEALAPFTGRVATAEREPPSLMRAMIPTMPTPPTGRLRSGRLAEVKEDAGPSTENGPPSGTSSEGPPAKRGKHTSRVVAARLSLAMLVVVAAVLLLWGLGRSSPSAERQDLARRAHAVGIEPIEPPTDGPRERTAPVPTAAAVATTAPVSDQTAGTPSAEEPPTQGAPAVVPSLPPTTTANGPRNVRTLFDHDRTKHDGHFRSHSSTTSSRAPALPAAQSEPTPRAPRGGDVPIDIQRENPYDP